MDVADKTKTNDNLVGLGADGPAGALRLSTSTWSPSASGPADFSRRLPPSSPLPLPLPSPSNYYLTPSLPLSNQTSIHSNSNFHSQSRLSRAYSTSSPLGNSIAFGTTKGRSLEPGISEVHARRASFSVSPSSSTVRRAPSLPSRSRPESDTSDSAIQDLALAESQLQSALGERPHHHQRNSLSAYDSYPYYTVSPELCAIPLARLSSSDPRTRRVSDTSIYPLASARGIIHTPSKNRGPEPGTYPRSVPGFVPSDKGLGSSQSEAGVSNVTVTTSSVTQLGQVTIPGRHHLSPRDLHSQPLDLVGRNQRNENDNMQNNAPNLRPQPDRSRSRAKRRFSGSTANSSHSPSSDRGPHHREKEDGKSILFQAFRALAEQFSDNLPQ